MAKLDQWMFFFFRTVSKVSSFNTFTRLVHAELFWYFQADSDMDFC